MPVSFEHNCIFVHIPKNGGTSIKQSLGIPEQDYSLFTGGHEVRLFHETLYCSTNHATARILQIFFYHKFAEMLKFSVVRNPYDRAVSQFLYNKKVGLGLYKNSDDKNRITRIVSVAGFGEWLKWYYERPDNYGKVPQYYHLYYNGVCLVDKILRFENLEQEYNEMCKQHNINAKPLPKVNQSEYLISKEEFLTEENKKIIYDYFSIDFKTFNYPP